MIMANWAWLIRRLLLAGFAMALDASLACAHLASDSYLRIELDAHAKVNGQWDIALRDLEAAVGLDAGPDGVVTWGKLRAKQSRIEAYAFNRLTIGGGACALQSDGFMVDYHAGNAYAVLRFTADCAQALRPLTLNYRLLFDLDPTHRGLLTIVQPGGERSEVLSPEHPEVALDLAPSSAIESIGRFTSLGISHILLGYDHLLFIAVLLIVAPFHRGARTGWKPLDGFGRVLIETLKILTAFTLAHAISLTLAVLGVVDVPSRVVDPAVAITIMVAAIDNIRPILPQLRWAVAFGFGLIHGLAFASALAPMRLQPSGLALALGSFNIGVELGQIALALLLIPIVYVVRWEKVYLRLFAPALSLAAFGLASIWFVERIAGFI
jgi:HupE / UreJ protein